jgi:hypothetical protein
MPLLDASESMKKTASVGVKLRPSIFGWRKRDSEAGQPDGVRSEISSTCLGSKLILHQDDPVPESTDVKLTKKLLAFRAIRNTE